MWDVIQATREAAMKAIKVLGVEESRSQMRSRYALEAAKNEGGDVMKILARFEQLRQAWWAEETRARQAKWDAWQPGDRVPASSPDLHSVPS
jgi:hypothetical protein